MTGGSGWLTVPWVAGWRDARARLLVKVPAKVDTGGASQKGG